MLFVPLGLVVVVVVVGWVRGGRGEVIFFSFCFFSFYILYLWW